MGVCDGSFLYDSLVEIFKYHNPILYALTSQVQLVGYKIRGKRSEVIQFIRIRFCNGFIIFRIIAIKVLLDQTILTIPLLLGFFPYMSWCQDQQDVFRELKEKFWMTYGLSCLWFLPAQTINFIFVPPQYRILYNGVCGFVWANILCAVKRTGE